MPVIHRGDAAPSDIFKNTPTGRRYSSKSQVKKAEAAAVKKALRAEGYRDGDRVVNKATGEIAVIDYSAPYGMRSLWKATNAHNHGTRFTLGVDVISKSKGYDGPAYGDLAGSDDDVAKRRGDRPANPNSRL